MTVETKGRVCHRCWVSGRGQDQGEWGVGDFWIEKMKCGGSAELYFDRRTESVVPRVWVLEHVE